MISYNLVNVMYYDAKTTNTSFGLLNWDHSGTGNVRV